MSERDIDGTGFTGLENGFAAVAGDRKIGGVAASDRSDRQIGLPLVGEGEGLISGAIRRNCLVTEGRGDGRAMPMPLLPLATIGGVSLRSAERWQRYRCFH